MAEYFDLYDENRKPLGRVIERGKPLKDGEYHLGVSVWIYNSKGEWLISRRSPDKYPKPGMWEATGGGVSAGEDTLAGAVREAKEELGVSLNPEEGVLFLTKKSRHAFGDTWVFKSDEPIEAIVLQPGETCDAKWAAPEEILRMTKSGEFLAPENPPYMMELFERFTGKVLL